MNGMGERKKPEETAAKMGKGRRECEGAEREKPYQYWLVNIRGLGKRKFELLKKFGSAEEIYRAAPGFLQAAAGERAAAKIAEAKGNWNILEEYEKLCRQKIKFTCYGDADYPGRLLEIPDPPYLLYYQGELPADDMPAAALIGARACSEYGAYAAREFGSKLARTGIQIISGLAMGIDGIAQEAALAAGGRSFGVLGCGVDVCYPRSNRTVYEACKAQGGVLSEYPPGTRPAVGLFPPRNRIISALSDVVVVIEAREKSGTLITVDMALEQGREVFAVPGRITDSLSRGCNRLFKQGAGVAVSPVDILEALYGTGGAVKAANNIEETARARADKRLSEKEKQVYRQLTRLSKTPEEIYGQMGKTMTVQEVMGTLVELCIKGFAERTAAGYRQKVLAT